MRRFRLAMPLAAAALAACQAPAERSVEDAWARRPAASGRPAAAYLTLKGGAAGATLVGIETPAAERAGNEPSRRAMLAAGFQEIGRRDHVWPDGAAVEDVQYELVL